MPYDVSDVGHTEAELDIEKDRSIRMATILGFKVVRLLAVAQHSDMTSSALAQARLLMQGAKFEREN